MIQDPSNDLLFSFEVNEDPSLIDEYTLAFVVSSDDYPDYITPKVASLPVSVRCTGPQLIETWIVPSTWNPNEYDESWTSSLPTYSSCFMPYTNLSFEFNDSTGLLLPWITVDTDPTQFLVTLSKAVYLTYLEQTISATIKATDQSDPARFNDVATFSIYFDR